MEKRVSLNWWRCLRQIWTVPKFTFMPILNTAIIPWRDEVSHIWWIFVTCCVWTLNVPNILSSVCFSSINYSSFDASRQAEWVRICKSFLYYFEKRCSRVTKRLVGDWGPTTNYDATFLFIVLKLLIIRAQFVERNRMVYGFMVKINFPLTHRQKSILIHSNAIK
jgi:hypothetical protein